MTVLLEFVKPNGLTLDSAAREAIIGAVEVELDARNADSQSLHEQ